MNKFIAQQQLWCKAPDMNLFTSPIGRIYLFTYSTHSNPNQSLSVVTYYPIKFSFLPLSPVSMFWALDLILRAFAATL